MHHHIGIVLVFIIALNLAFFVFVTSIERELFSSFCEWRWRERFMPSLTALKLFFISSRAFNSSTPTMHDKTTNKSKNRQSSIDVKTTITSELLFLHLARAFRMQSSRTSHFYLSFESFLKFGVEQHASNAQDDGAGQRRRFTLWPAQQQHTSLSPYVSGICTKVWEECAHYSEDSGLIWVALFS